MIEHSVVQSSELLRRGFEYKELSRMKTAGDLERVRRGAYVWRSADDAVTRHRQLIEASLPVLSDGSVVSHHSAAVLYGLPSWDAYLNRVHVIRERDEGGRVGSVVHVHPMVLPAQEITQVDGVIATTLARTVVDCARVLPYDRGVAVGDAALRLGLQRDELSAVLSRKPRRVGNPKARRMTAFVDERSESVGESLSRVRMEHFDLPAPVLQYEVIDPYTGELIARTDFAWPEWRTLGEFDGQVKYGRLLKPGVSPGDAVFTEKVREDRARDQNYSMVRWIHADLADFAAVAARLRRAFRRLG